MLANYGMSRAQKKKVIAPVGETSPYFVAPSGETIIYKKYPKNSRVVQEKHENIKVNPR